MNKTIFFAHEKNHQENNKRIFIGDVWYMKAKQRPPALEVKARKGSICGWDTDMSPL